jgi:transposase
MPKKVDPALKDRALRMVAEHQADYPSVTAGAKVVANQLGLGKETVRRWVVQAEIDAGARPGTSSEESAEIQRLEAENRRLPEDNEILRKASILFASNTSAGVFHPRILRVGRCHGECGSAKNTLVPASNANSA